MFHVKHRPAQGSGRFGPAAVGRTGAVPGLLWMIVMTRSVSWSVPMAGSS